MADLQAADPDGLVAEFGPRMGRWYADLAHGRGSQVVDDTPWVARGHSRETTYQANLVGADAIAQAAQTLVDEVLQDVAREGRPVVRVTLKVRYAPFFTKTFSRTLPEPTGERQPVADAVLALVDRLEPGREVRLLGVRAEMAMPAAEEGAEGGDAVERTPVRGPV